MSHAGNGSLRDNPVVVTGVGVVTALGRTAAETWNGLLSAKDGVRPSKASMFRALVAKWPLKYAASIPKL